LFAWLIPTAHGRGKSMTKKATTRALMALATDIADHQALGDRIKAQFEVLAKEHRVKIPGPAVR
jgi:hypothetical protein